MGGNAYPGSVASLVAAAAAGSQVVPIIGGGTSLDFRTAVLAHGAQRQAAAANVAASAVIPATPSKFSWLTTVIFWCGSAATAGALTCTLSGLPTIITSLDLTFTTTQGDRIIIQLPTPMVGSIQNQAITATVPASGASGPAIGVEIFGFNL